MVLSYHVLLMVLLTPSYVRQLHTTAKPLDPAALHEPGSVMFTPPHTARPPVPADSASWVQEPRSVEPSPSYPRSHTGRSRVNGSLEDQVKRLAKGTRVAKEKLAKRRRNPECDSGPENPEQGTGNKVYQSESSNTRTTAPFSALTTGLNEPQHHATKKTYNSCDQLWKPLLATSNQVGQSAKWSRQMRSVKLWLANEIEGSALQTQLWLAYNPEQASTPERHWQDGVPGSGEGTGVGRLRWAA